jgi:hypothetical protein
MACAHTAAMLLGNCDGYSRLQNVSLAASIAETLRKLRHGGSQHVRVEHVHINEGGQAVIGNVSPAGKY